MWNLLKEVDAVLDPELGAIINMISGFFGAALETTGELGGVLGAIGGLRPEEGTITELSGVLLFDLMGLLGVGSHGLFQ